MNSSEPAGLDDNPCNFHVFKRLGFFALNYPTQLRYCIPAHGWPEVGGPFYSLHSQIARKPDRKDRRAVQIPDAVPGKPEAQTQVWGVLTHLAILLKILLGTTTHVGSRGLSSD